MKPINPLRLVFLGVVLALLGWAGTVLASRYSWSTPLLPAAAMISMLVIVVLTLVLGLRVFRWRNSTKKKTFLDPILAARTLILAQACAYAGTVLLGWHVGIFLDQFSTWGFSTSQGLTWQAVGVAAGGLVMLVVGLVVEWFCKIPPDDGDSAPGNGVRRNRGETEGEGEYAYRGD